MGPWNDPSPAPSESGADTQQKQEVKESTPHEPLHVGEDDYGELGTIPSHIDHVRQPDEEDK